MNPFIVLVVATFTIAFTIPVVTYIIGRKTVDADKDPGDTRRSRALPFIGNGKIPPERDRDVSEDRHTFAAIIKLFFRSWPFIRIQLFGRWFYEGKGTSQTLADSVESDGYHYKYAPLFITVIAIVGPLFQWVPASLSYPLPFLYIGVGLIDACKLR